MIEEKGRRKKRRERKKKGVMVEQASKSVREYVGKSVSRKESE